ncbi:MAG: methyl-accepting chemotaxis protein [Nitrospiria bacterium]
MVKKLVVSSIRIKFCILVALLLIVLNSVNTFFVIQEEEKMIRSSMESKAKAVAMSLSASGAKVVIENLFLIQESLSGFSRLKDVSGIMFIDENGMVSAAQDTSRIGDSLSADPFFQRALLQKKELLDYYQDKNGYEMLGIFEPMLTDGAVHGWIRLDLSMKETQEKIRLISIKLSLLALLFITLGTFLTYVFSNKIISGLKTLVDRFKKMAEGDFSQKLTLQSEDELGEVTRSYNVLVDQMSHVFQKLQNATFQLSSISREINQGSQLIEKGAENTLASSSETNRFLDTLNTSVKQFEKEIHQLTVGIEKNATSVIEVGQTTHVVAENMETLSASIHQTIDSIGLISTSVIEVNKNTEVLSNAAVSTAEETRLLDNIIKELSRNIEMTRALSDRSLSYAQKGVEDVLSTKEGIEKIKDFGIETNKVMNNLGAKAEKIGLILTVINNIAQETNLLALNAAIISSQAGEHGKGFSVVANEIKDLADRTVVSTQEIKELIRVLQEESSHAVNLVKKGNEIIDEGATRATLASNALNNIIKNAQESSKMVNEINAAVTDQSTASNRISSETSKIANEAVRILGIAQQQAKEAEQVYKASGQMKDISIQVKGFTEENSKETRHVIETTEENRKMINFIKNAVTELSNGSTIIVNAAQNIQKIASENMNLVKSRENLAKDLSSQSEDLTRLTSGFKIYRPDGAESFTSPT